MTPTSGTLENSTQVEKYHKDISISDIQERIKKNVPIKEIAQQLNCSESNIYKRLDKHRQLLRQAKDYVADREQQLQSKQALLLKHINEESIKKSSLSQRVIAFGVLLDKERALTGKDSVTPRSFTQIIVNVDKQIRGGKPQDIVIEGKVVDNEEESDAT